MFKTTTCLIKLLIKDNEINAKDYVKNQIQTEINKIKRKMIKKLMIFVAILAIIDCFGQYTLEAIIIHVLGVMFGHKYPTVRGFLEQLDSTVRVHSSYL